MTIRAGWRLPLAPAGTIVLAAVLPAALRLALLPVLPIPVPSVHDEFSNLLAADTFAHGRLANPPHQLAPFFESFHILVRPTYASMYPPGPGAFMALGQVLLGHPWWGVFLASALMRAAITWLLLAWAPPRWALVGGLSFGLLFGIESYWINSYWGGAVPALGGALMVGAVSRLLFPERGHPSPVVCGLLAGLGAGVLLFSRPWEGGCLGAACCCVLLWRVARPRASEARRFLLRAALPALAVLMVAAGFLAYYDQRVTGDPFLPPYVQNLKTYYVAPLFLWQDEKPARLYPNESMRRFYTGWRDSEGSLRRAEGTRNPLVGLAMWFWDFKVFAGAVLAGLVAAVRLKRGRHFLLLAIFALVLTGLSVQSVRQLHYLAPAAGVLVAVQVLGLRTLSPIRIRGRRLRFLPAAVLVAATIGSARNVVLHAGRSRETFACRREELVARLQTLPGRHVVVVRYAPTHNVHDEWVYNGADIDGSKVVFAHDLGPGRDRALFDYYRGRRFWLLAPDESDEPVLTSR